ncbi:hypothetical protein [Scytonema millei]|uniref:Uncharacterized protein n=1 Tax=Scytonema millei VB511283 TaxID=1245923 RepID=A0A9X5E204_9CYAN|nr:hypothetical protein [Scytonema millei]NHC33875.1 hypothetical protein [Scytonema millei VB511283]
MRPIVTEVSNQLSTTNYQLPITSETINPLPMLAKIHEVASMRSPSRYSPSC